MDNNILGVRINTALAMRHMLQKDLARAIGVKDNVVSYYCSGTRKPSIEQLIKMSQILEVSVDYLLGRSSVESPDLNVQTAAKVTGLSGDAIKALCEMAEPERFGGDWTTLRAVDALLRAVGDKSKDAEAGYALVDIANFFELDRRIDSKKLKGVLNEYENNISQSLNLERLTIQALEDAELHFLVDSLRYIKLKYYLEDGAGNGER